MGTHPLTLLAPPLSWPYEAPEPSSSWVPPSQHLLIHWSSWPGPYPMSNPSRFFSTLLDETEHILLPGRASLEPPKLPTVLELASLAQFALNQRQNISHLCRRTPGSPKGLCRSLEVLWSPNPRQTTHVVIIFLFL